ncbi:MAG: type VI secretion system baseplate subunit TssK [Terriglobales bacterium]
MKHLSRIVWFEGMYLGPHHFQAQNRAFEDLVQFSASSLWFEPSGMAGLELDAAALRNGMVSLVHARGFFPDGLAFHMPDFDPLPEPRECGEFFPPTRESLTVLLAVPARRENGPNCAMTPQDRAEGFRYAAEERLLYDETTGRDEKPVQVGRKNVGFLFDQEDAEGRVTLPVARVVRDGTGRLVYDPAFIPPCLQIGASERLTMILRRLVEILSEKSASLALARRGASKFQAGFSSEDVAAFWFVHTVNAGLSVLRHLYLSQRAHPEQLYTEMVRLAGALCSFGLESHPQTLPLYDHLHLDRCFQALDEHIRAHLELVVPTHYISVPLRRVGPYLYEGDIADQRTLDRARWVFALHANIGEAELISSVPRLVKICSAELLPQLVKTALPGLSLTHLPVPPSAIAPRVEYQYFGVSRAGSCWEHIVETRKVGLYVPGGIPDPELELAIILE